jgi:hypothetical protein
MIKYWRGRGVGHALALAILCGAAGHVHAQSADPVKKPDLIPTDALAERPLCRRPNWRPTGCILPRA